MQVFKYSFFVRLIYKYGNILASFILLFYLLASILGLTRDWKFIFPLLITLLLLYALNKFYLKIYRSFPFKIEIDNEKMICSEFVFNNRIVEIFHSDINSIKGGIFSSRAYMPLYVSTNEHTFGISPHLKNFNNLLTIVLTNIPKELYTSLLEEIKKLAINKPARGKK